MHQYQKLKAWQLAMNLSIDIYKLSGTFPSSEKYGVQSQIHRAAVSIPSNIAEGAGRNSSGEWKYFLGVASGSSFELYTQLVICQRLGYVSGNAFEQSLDRLQHLQNMLFKLIKSI